MGNGIIPPPKPKISRVEWGHETTKRRLPVVPIIKIGIVCIFWLGVASFAGYRLGNVHRLAQLAQLLN